MVTGSDDNTATWRAARSCRGSRRESCTKFCGLTQQGASAESVKQSILTVNDAGVDFTFQDAGRGGVGMSLLSGAWNVKGRKAKLFFVDGKSVGIWGVRGF